MPDDSEHLSEFLRKEHREGLHTSPFRMCPICHDTVARPTAEVEAGPPLEDPIDPPEPPTRGNLAGAFRRIRQNITTYVEEHPDGADDSQPTSPLDGGAWCETCKGYRFVRPDVPVDHPSFAKAFPCPSCYEPILKQKRLSALFGELGEKLQGHTLQNFQVDTRPRRVALEKVQDWLRDPGNPWLYLNGPVGIGKTHLAVGALRDWIELGHSGTFKLSRDLLDRIRQGYDDGSYRDVMEALVKTDLLVIDDLGSERHKESTDDDWASEKLFQIVGGRYDNNRRMIITANYSLGALAKRLGNQRLTSRILEMATTKYNVDMSRLSSFRDIIAGLFSRGEDE